MVLLLFTAIVLMGALMTGHIAWLIVGISMLVLFVFLDAWTH